MGRLQPKIGRTSIAEPTNHNESPRRPPMRIGSMAVLSLSLIAGGAQAQSAPSGKTLASTINVYVFPTAGQTPEKQSMEEVECYNYAVNSTGSDPFDLQKKASSQQQQTEQQVQQAKASTQGARGKGALGGAAAGAL